MLIRELKALRVRNGFTQKELAEKLGMSETSYSKRENMIIDFTIDEVKKLRKILDMSNEEIIRIFFSEKVA